MKILLALTLAAAPLPAYAQSASLPEQRTVTLEDVCNGGATEFTDEHDVLIQCPEDPAAVSWGDVWAETDHPNDSMAQAYCVWRARLCPLVRRAMRSGHVNDRELARIEAAAASARMPQPETTP